MCFLLTVLSDITEDSLELCTEQVVSVSNVDIHFKIHLSLWQNA